VVALGDGRPALSEPRDHIEPETSVGCDRVVVCEEAAIYIDSAAPAVDNAPA
jgi:hypothetical protein